MNLTFLFEVYVVLLISLFIAFGIVYKTRNEPEFIEKLENYRLLLFITSIVIIVVLGWAEIPFILKFILFMLFAVLGGFSLTLLTYRFEVNLVNKALIGTIITFVATSILGYVLLSMGYNLNFMKMGILVGLISMLIIGVVFLFVPVDKSVYRLYLSAIFILFSILTIYDTNIITQEGYTGDAVDGAVSFFLNIQNIFTSLFQLDVLDSL